MTHPSSVEECSRPRVAGPAVVAVALAWLAAGALAQEAGPGGSPIDWQTGPATGRLGDIAEIRVPDGFRFADARGAARFLELTHNPSSGREVGVMLSAPDANDDFWFAIFEFDEVGYVKDDERDKLDADKLLSTIRKGNEAANEERRKRGWDTIDVVGWEQAPFYDPETHNLSWSIRGRGKEGDVINYSTRLLGRKGVMQVDMVLGPGQLASQLPVFRSTIAGYTFQAGQRYAEFRAGDKVAKYGLTALIAGGAGALAAKSGLLGKLWKLLVAAAIAVVAALRKLWTKLTGRSPRADQPEVSTAPRYPGT